MPRKNSLARGRRQLGKLCLAAGAVLLMGRQSSADGLGWNGGSGDWFDPNNWTNYSTYLNTYLPDYDTFPSSPNDTAAIGSGTVMISTFSSGYAVAGEVLVDKGGTLELSGSGNLEVNGDNYIGDGEYISGDFEQTGGLNYTSPGAVEDYIIVSPALVLQDNGAYTLSAGSLYSYGPEVLGIFATAPTLPSIFNQSGGLNLAYDELDLGGTLYKGNVYGTQTASFAGSGTYLLSGGTLFVAGNAYVGGSSTGVGGSGNLMVDGNGLLNVMGTLTALSGNGSEIILSGGTINTEYLNVQGESSLFNWQSGTLGLLSSVTLDSAAGPTTTAGYFGSSFALGTDQMLNVIGNETLGGTGSFSLTVDSGGTNNVEGTLTVVNGSGSSLSLNGGTINTESLNLDGEPSVFNWISGTLGLTSGVSFGSEALPTTTGGAFGSSLTLGAEQTLNVTGNETLGNQGSFNLTINTGGTNTVTGTLSVATSGTYNLQGGALSAGAITINSGGTLTNTCAVLFTAGTSTISGTYNVQINGPANGPFGQLTVNQASLAGGINATLGSTYAGSGSVLPSTTDNYPILSYQSLSGAAKQTEAAATFSSNGELAGLFLVNNSQNNVSLSDFASVLALANLSNSAYASIPVSSGGYSYESFPNGSDKSNPGFLAEAFTDASTGQIIIAFRGTQLDNGKATALQNLLADASFVAGKNPFLEADVKDAAIFVKTVQQEDPDADIILTGHSLGGALAQLVGKASGLNAIAFNAPGGQQLYGQLGNDLQVGSWISFTASNTVVNTNFRMDGDQVSLAGTPIGPQVTLPNPFGQTLFTPNPNPLLDLITNVGTYLGPFHSINTLISVLSNSASPIQPTWQNDMPALTSLVNTGVIISHGVGLITYDMLFPVSSSLYEGGALIDPGAGSDYVLTAQAGSPNILSIALPTEPGVASYNVRYEHGGIWSSYVSIQPGAMDNLGALVTGVEFNAVDSTGNGVTLPQFVFEANFANTGTFTGTLSETGISESASSSLWNIYGSGSWALGSNWSGLNVPLFAQDAVSFGPSNTAAAVVTLDGGWTVGTVNFASSNSYTIAPGTIGNLTFDNGETAASINVSSGSHFITAPLALNSSVVISINTLGNALTISGSITGTGGLTESGAGTLTLSGSNSYTGLTTILGGALGITSDAAINYGKGGLVFSGGSLQFDGYTSTLSFANTTNLTLGAATGSASTLSGNMTGSTSLTFIGPGTLNLTGANNYSGGTTLAGGTLAIGLDTEVNDGVGGLTFSGGILQFNNYISALFFANIPNVSLGAATGAPSTLSGQITGSYGLSFVGPGTLNLVGSNSYTGATNLGGGVLCIGSDTAINGGKGGFIFSGGILQLDNYASSLSFANTPGVILGAAVGSSSSLSGNVTGSSSIVFAGPGTLVLAGSNTYTGRTSISSGELQLASAAAIGAGGLTLAGGTLDVNGFSAIVGSLSGPAGTVDNISAGGSVMLTVGAGNGSGIFSGDLTNTTGMLSVLKAGSGTQVLSNSAGNSYGGGTNIQGGTLAIVSDAQIGSGPLTFSGGTLQFDNFGSTLAFANAANLSLGAANGSASTMSGNITGSYGLTFVGPGTLTLSGSNGYAGTTSINGGLLIIGSSAAFPNGSVVTIGTASATATMRLAANIGSVTIPSLIVNPGSTLDITNNTLAINNVWSNSGQVLLEGGQISGAAITNIATGNISGYGTLNTGGLTNNATFTLGGDSSSSLYGNVVNNGTMTFAGAVTVNGNLTNSANQTVNLTGTTANQFYGTFSNTGTLVVVNGASGSLLGGYIGSGPIQNNGTLSIGANSVSGKVSGAGKLVLVAIGSPAGFQILSNSGTSTMGALAISIGSTLNITNNRLAINFGSPANDPVASIAGYLKSGYAGGAWTGTSGIISTTAQTRVGPALSVGYADGNTDPGTAAGPNQIVVKYTLAGDTNLDGLVNFADLVAVLQNFNKGNTDWAHGNFAYGASTNFGDLVAVLQNYNKTLTPAGSSSEANGGGSTPLTTGGSTIPQTDSPSIQSTDVPLPEPGALALAAAGACGLLNRRRTKPRRNKIG